MGQGWSLFGGTPAYSGDYMNSIQNFIPKTVGDPDQVGRVWIAKSGKGCGHLSVLVAVDGRCEFEVGKTDVPIIFFGAQFHVGLDKDENGRRTRRTRLICEGWHPGGAILPRPFIVDGNAKLFPILNEDGSYAKIKNVGNHSPDLWSLRLADYALEVYNALAERQPEKVDEKAEKQFEAAVNKELDGKAKFVNEHPLSDDKKRWDSVLNCHTFSVRFIEALSLHWPPGLDHSGNHADWLVDTILTQQHTSASITESTYALGK